MTNNNSTTNEVKTLTIADLQKIKGALSTQTQLFSAKAEDRCGNKADAGGDPYL